MSLRVVGLPLDRNEAAIKLPDGSVFLHSPLKISESHLRELDALGPVRWMLLPSRFHTLFYEDYFGAFPDATFIGAKSVLAEFKRRAKPICADRRLATGVAHGIGFSARGRHAESRRSRGVSPTHEIAPCRGFGVQPATASEFHVTIDGQCCWDERWREIFPVVSFFDQRPSGVRRQSSTYPGVSVPTHSRQSWSLHRARRQSGFGLGLQKRNGCLKEIVAA